MFREKQSGGFSVIGVIMILAVTAIIGLAGWLAWDNSKQSKAFTKETTPSPQSINEPPDAQQDQSPVQTDPSENGKYLVIKEWGVKILLPNELEGNAFYSLREFDESYGHAEGADISSKSFEPECRGTASDVGLTVVRTSTELTDTAPYIYKLNVLHKGTHWYHNAFGKDGCAKLLSGDKAALFNKLYDSVGTIESTN